MEIRGERRPRERKGVRAESSSEEETGSTIRGGFEGGVSVRNPRGREGSEGGPLLRRTPIWKQEFNSEI